MNTLEKLGQQAMMDLVSADKVVVLHAASGDRRSNRFNSNINALDGLASELRVSSHFLGEEDAAYALGRLRDIRADLEVAESNLQQRAGKKNLLAQLAGMFGRAP